MANRKRIEQCLRSPSIARLMRKMRSRKPSTRLQAANRLFRCAMSGKDMKQAIPILAKSINDTDPFVKEYALAALDAYAWRVKKFDLGKSLSTFEKNLSSSTAPILISHYLRRRPFAKKNIEALLTHPDWVIRVRSLQGLRLGLSRSANAFVFRTLKQILQKNTGTLLYGALTAIRKMETYGIDIEPFVPYLEKSLDRGGDKNVITILLTEHYLRNRNWPKFCRLLESRNSIVRFRTLDTLVFEVQRVRIPRHIMRLLEKIRETDANFRTKAEAVIRMAGGIPKSLNGRRTHRRADPWEDDRDPAKRPFA